MLFDGCGVYIITDPSHAVLYTGMSTNVAARILSHKQKILDGFAKKYNCTKLVYIEGTPDKATALFREKQIKGYSRHKKLQLILLQNPEWKDLGELMGL